MGRRQIAKNTFFLYVRILVTIVVSLYTSRVILQVLGAEDFGIYNVVGGCCDVFFSECGNGYCNSTFFDV